MRIHRSGNAETAAAIAAVNAADVFRFGGKSFDPDALIAAGIEGCEAFEGSFLAFTVGGAARHGARKS